MIPVKTVFPCFPTLRSSDTKNNSKHLFIARSVHNSLKKNFKKIGYFTHICHSECHKSKATLLLQALQRKILCRHIINYIMENGVCSSFLDVFCSKPQVWPIRLFIFHYSKQMQSMQTYKYIFVCKLAYKHTYTVTRT